MHMISKKDLNSGEMDTLTKSCSPTIVTTANGKVQTHEEATVYVMEGHALSELEPQYQKDKGRVALRDDIVKDDSGSYAVFTEQGSSASQMTAAKIMDITSRLPGCAGQAADAVPDKTQVKNGRCSKIIENSQIGMSRYLDSSAMTQMA